MQLGFEILAACGGVAVASSLLGCALHSRVAPDRDIGCDDLPIVNIQGGKGVVFPAETGWFDGYAPREEAVTGYWTPRDDDLRKAELALHGCMEAQVLAVAENLDLYSRQYVGVAFGQTKRVFINLFRHSEAFPQWRCRPVVVDDGGDWYFRMEYDVETNKCVRLMVNGGA